MLNVLKGLLNTLLAKIDEEATGFVGEKDLTILTNIIKDHFEHEMQKQEYEMLISFLKGMSRTHIFNEYVVALSQVNNIDPEIIAEDAFNEGI